MTAVGDFLVGIYLWIKAFHIIAVISWMAGMLYLPRLFVYHAERAPEPGQLRDTMKVMQRKLLKGIVNPAGVAVWFLGVILVFTPGVVDWSAPWVYAKAVLVVALTVYHHLLVRWWRAFAEDRNVHSGRFYRVWNEVPAVIMIGIVILVIVRPF